MALGTTEETEHSIKNFQENSATSSSSLDSIVNSCPRKKQSVLQEKGKNSSKDLEHRLSLFVEEGYGFKKSCLVQENRLLSFSDHLEKEEVSKAQSIVLTEDEEMAIEGLILLSEYGIVENFVPEKKSKMMNSNNGGIVKKRKKVIDEDGDDLVPEKKRKMMNKNSGSNLKKGKKKVDNDDDGPNPPPGMPQEFKNRISQLVGANRVISGEKLVIQKKLETTDVGIGHNRFSIPMSKLREEYLEEHEKGKKTQLVHIVDPSLRHYEVNLSYWVMSKPCYVLNGPMWRKIRETNDLRSLMIMQLWAVRVDNELWLALVNITPPVAERGSDHAEISSAGGPRGSSK